MTTKPQPGDLWGACTAPHPVRLFVVVSVAFNEATCNAFNLYGHIIHGGVYVALECFAAGGVMRPVLLHGAVTVYRRGRVVQEGRP